MTYKETSLDRQTDRPVCRVPQKQREELVGSPVSVVSREESPVEDRASVFMGKKGGREM